MIMGILVLFFFDVIYFVFIFNVFVVFWIIEVGGII